MKFPLEVLKELLRLAAVIAFATTLSPGGLLLFCEDSDGNPEESPFAKSRAIERRMNGNFFFYGKIVDQHDRPVSGVTVTLSASRVVAGLASANVKTGVITTSTDVNGIFSFIDAAGYLFIIKTKLPGYIVDDHHLTLDYTYKDTIKCDRLSGKLNPHVLRAWKLGEPSENREIELGRGANEGSFKVNDKRELLATIKLELNGAGETRRLLRNPILQASVGDAGVDKNWDLALSLVSDSLGAGVSPFSAPGTKRPENGVAVRVRTRTGELCQADPIFPLVARGMDYSRSIDLKWKNSIKSNSDAYFRVFYRNKENGYFSFITIAYINTSISDQNDCYLSFRESALLPVPQLGVINVSGSENLEYFPEFIRNREVQEEDRAEQEERQRLMRKYQEAHLLEIRLKDPALAREIEARMRAEGKQIPP